MFPSAQWSSLYGMGAAAKQQVRLLPGVINSAQKSKATPMTPEYMQVLYVLFVIKKTSKIFSGSGSFKRQLITTWSRNVQE